MACSAKTGLCHMLIALLIDLTPLPPPHRTGPAILGAKQDYTAMTSSLTYGLEGSTPAN